MMHVVIVIHNFQRGGVGGADPPPSTKRMDVITKWVQYLHSYCTQGTPQSARSASY